MLRKIEQKQGHRHVFKIGPHKVPVAVIDREIGISPGSGGSDMMNHCIRYMQAAVSAKTQPET